MHKINRQIKAHQDSWWYFQVKSRKYGYRDTCFSLTHKHTNVIQLGITEPVANFFLARYYTKFFCIDVCILILASSTVVLSVQSVKSKIVVFFFFLQFYAEISNHS